MAAGKLNLVIEQGATFRKTLAVQDAAGAVVPLAGYAARMQARARLTDPDPPLLDLTTLSGGLVLDDAAGTVTIVLTDEQTAALAWTAAVYDLELESPAGDVLRLVKGTIRVDPEVTR